MKLFAVVVALSVATFVPWGWFSYRMFILAPSRAGSLAEGYELIGLGRAVQGIVYLAVGCAIGVGFVVLGSRRIRATDAWLFGPYSFGRTAKWVSAAIPFGLALAIVPPAALVADLGGDAFSGGGDGVSWDAIPSFVILFTATASATILFLVDLVGGWVRGRRDQRYEAR